MDSSSAFSQPNFYDFLNRMRHPASADLVRAIKSFIVSFSFHTTDAENDSRKLQDFLVTMESTIKEHPLWAHASHEEIDSAVEGLEKYVMTKLFNRTFASSPEDVKADLYISEKIRLLQHFVRPDHLDVPRVLRNEASWLANPPQLHSNLKFIQLFRRQSKLVSEVEYYLTNLISAETFITNINASSLSMEESEFQENMQSAKIANEETVTGHSSVLQLSEDDATTMRRHGKEIHVNLEGCLYPFMGSEAKELTTEDVQQLLRLYQQVVTRYTMLTKALARLSLHEEQLLHIMKDPAGSTELKKEIEKRIHEGAK
ncbi:vacuolar protein sorting-associated protein 9A-like isoform X3 [Phoenix dactylifera]|uniref:Vacuolar protein sorting-associated protein 9A-like isoform X3 n=1 Tax=Phoenix dactylifera TaxID=42345 RepID=A0A8B8ZMF4_PHODC|nr:vacuolar protein sorting-associated protein 9A-like isoform X3 [Phoenix dactylifera]